MQEIFEGIDKFQTKVFPYMEKRYSQLANEQHPHTLFITCCDSRVVPSMITLTEPGELFICRTIGNVVPAHGSQDTSVASAVEYAVHVLGVTNIVVCGHSDCGAMKGLLHPEKLKTLAATSAWLKHAEAAGDSLKDNTGSEAERLKTLIQANVLLQLEHLRTHPGVLAKNINLCGLVYDIGTGSIREVGTRSALLAKGAA